MKMLIPLFGLIVVLSASTRCGEPATNAVAKVTKAEPAPVAVDPDTPTCDDSRMGMTMVRVNRHTNRDESCLCVYAGDGRYYWRGQSGQVGSAVRCPPSIPFVD